QHILGELPHGLAARSLAPVHVHRQADDERADAALLDHVLQNRGVVAEALGPWERLVRGGAGERRIRYGEADRLLSHVETVQSAAAGKIALYVGGVANRHAGL